MHYLKRLIMFSSMALSLPAHGEGAQIEWSKISCQDDERGFCHDVADKLASQGRKNEAMILYTRVCRAGDGAACAEVGWFLQNEGKKQDAILAFEKGCDLEHGASCFYVGTLSEATGKHKSARVAWTKACDLKVKGACDKLVTPTDAPQDRKVGLAQLPGPVMEASLQCSTRFPQDCLKKGRHFLIKGVLDRAAKNFDIGCTSGQTVACQFLGQTFLEMNENDHALSAFQKACVRDSAAGCEAAGRLALERSKAEAAPFLRKACRLGLGSSCYILATGLKQPDGEFNESSMEYLEKGCHRGHTESCFSLKALNEVLNNTVTGH